jgi:hypothetical protein
MFKPPPPKWFEGLLFIPLNVLLLLLFRLADLPNEVVWLFLNPEALRRVLLLPNDDALLH